MANQRGLASTEMMICTWNAGGVRSHLLELQDFLQQHAVGVLMLSETNLKPEIAFSLPGYRIFRKDRLGRPGGGVAVCVTTKLTVQSVDIQTDIEAVGCKTELGGQLVRFIAIYIPPYQIVEPQQLQLLLSHPRTILGGDLNAKHPAWGCRSTNARGRMVFEVITSMQGAGLWAPEEATSAPPGNQQGDIIDFFMGYQMRSPRQVETISALSSDHYPVFCQWGRLPEAPPPTRRIRWDQFRSLSCHLGEHIDTYSSAADIERVSVEIQSSFQLVLDACSDEVSGFVDNRLRLRPAERDLIRWKNLLKSRWFKYRREADRRQFRRLQREVRAMLRDREDERWSARIQAANEVTGQFWKLLRGPRRQTTSAAPLIVDGSKYFHPAGKAHQAAQFYCKLF